MSIRHSLLASLVLGVSLLGPHLASADSICGDGTGGTIRPGETCVLTSGVNGVCDNNGKCVASTYSYCASQPNGTTCTTTSGAGGRCSSGTCVAQTVNQANGALCMQDQECISGYCNPNLQPPKCSQRPGQACGVASPCPSGTTCQSGTCVLSPGTAGVACSASNPCPTGSTCTAGTCVAGSGQQSTGPVVTLINPLGTGATLESFLNSILALVIRIGTIVVIIMLVYVGYLFVIAQGNESKLTEARRALLWTIIGALILLGAQAIALGIKATVEAISVGN